MKKIAYITGLALISIIFHGFTLLNENDPNNIIGFYWSPGKDAKIEIYQRAKKYFGKFVWMIAPRKDTKNPIKALQGRDVNGLEFLEGFSFSDGAYSGGEIYDPKTGKTYSCKMSLEENKLKVRGYIGISLFGRTEYFERIK